MVATPTNLTKNGSSVSATSYATASVTFTAGRFYLVSFASRTGITADPTQPTATATGMTFTVVATNGTQIYDTTGSSRKRQTLFYALCSSTTTVAVTFDEAGQTQTNAQWSIDEIASGLVTTGTNGVDAIVQSAKNADPSATASTLTVTLASFSSANNATYGTFANGGGTTTVTPGSGFTQISNDSTSTLAMLTEFNSGNDTTVDFGNNSVNDEMGGIALELNASVTVNTLGYKSLLGVGM